MRSLHNRRSANNISLCMELFLAKQNHKTVSMEEDERKKKKHSPVQIWYVVVCIGFMYFMC